MRADIATAVGYRIGDALAKCFVGNLPAQGLQKFEFRRAWLAGGGQFGPFEKTARARILAVKQVFVRPLEIIGPVQRLAHTRVVKRAAPCVENKGLHSLAVFQRHGFKLEAVLRHRINVIAGGPDARRKFAAIIDIAGFQCFKSDGVIAEIFVFDALEIKPALYDVQIVCPVIFIALVSNRATGIDPLNHVRARP